MSPVDGTVSGADRAAAASVRADAAIVLGVFALVGTLAGLVWAAVVDPVIVTRVEGGTTAAELELGRRFDADGWYFLVGAAAALVLGVLVTAWRSRNAVVTLLLVLAGTVLAALLMAGVGHLLGPDDPSQVLVDAAVGSTAPEQLRIGSWAVYLAWPLGAVAGALAVLWAPVDTTVGEGHREAAEI